MVADVKTTQTGRMCALLVGSLLLVGSAWAEAISLFADPTASRVGDALTVIIAESATASNQTSLSTEKTQAVEVGSQIPGAGNVLDFIPLHALQSDASNTYEGRASSSRSARLNARMTVTVVARKPNGDLIIDGVRTLKINGETEAIHVSGSVSPSVIRVDNTVSSASIGDLNIEYTGKGVITQGSRPGLVMRFVNWIF
jgi:flagellar L-ring protein FlgH